MRRLSSLLLPLVLVSTICVAQTHERAERVRNIYKQNYASRLVPLLSELLHFPTVADNTDARERQQKWIETVATRLGFTVRDAGLMTEVELLGPQDAPVLGLVVHGDVQPVDQAEWTFPPFAGVEKNGVVYGRGSADDKGPLVQALLAMAALRDSGIQRTYTIRLLVGSDEESANLDVTEYLKTHSAPALSLVLDSAFPVVVGEKAWTSYTITAPDAYAPASSETPKDGFAVMKLDAGLAASIVPSQAEAVLEWHGSAAALDTALAALKATKAAAGYKLTAQRDGNRVVVKAFGHAAHAGVNIEGGRNALVFLAEALDGKLAPSQATDLLLFAREAGADIYGTGLGLTTNDKLWGNYAVNVATIKTVENQPKALALTINIRALPALWGEPLHQFLDKRLAAFNAAHNQHFTSAGFFEDPPLAFHPDSKIVQRLLAAYTRATGERAAPAISGGGTYAKRIPNAIAFGMWFPGKPYPGHDVDEQITVKDLDRGVDVLIEALADIATSEPLAQPFQR